MPEEKLKIISSPGLTVYPDRPPKAPSAPDALVNDSEARETAEKPSTIPARHRNLARADGKEDEDYYKDVENLTHGHSRSAVINAPVTSSPTISTSLVQQPRQKTTWSQMIRLSAESAAFYQGSGWRSYENYVGTRILYPNYTSDIKSTLFENPNLRQVCFKLALDEVLAKHGVSVADISIDTASLPSSLSKSSTSNSSISREKFQALVDKQMQVCLKRLHKYIEDLVAHLDSKNTVRFEAFVTNNILVRMYNQGLHIKSSEFMAVRNAALQAEKNGHSLIFLPCHKSHVDYVVISYLFYRLGIALPHIAAGENLNIPIIGTFLKQGGAFFLRRTFGDDPLYGELFREYVELLLTRGHNIEVFIEGTRSRTGKLLSPRFGLLKIILDSVLLNKIDDCVIVPMSIDYDKVIETESYVTELLGHPKAKETLMGVLNSASILSLKLGRIDIRFAKPFSLRKWMNEQVGNRSTNDSLFAPSTNLSHRSTLLQSLGYRVLSDINSISIIMPTALVGCTMLTLRGRGVGREELIRRVTWLRREIIMKGGRVADFGGAEVEKIVDRALRALSDAMSVRSNLLEPVIYPTKRFELSLYRNQVIHHFVHESFVCAALYTVIKKGKTHLRIQKDLLLTDVVFLSRVLKSEFIFKPNTAEENLGDAVVVLADSGVIDIEDSSGKPWLPDAIEGARVLPVDFLVRMSDYERKIGRENFDFYCFLIWPFIETYWLAAISLFSIIPTDAPGGLSEKDMMERVQLFARTLYYEGDLGYFESINKETLRNAFKRYQEMGILYSSSITIQTGVSEFETKQELRLYVVPEYETEVAPLMRRFRTTESVSGDLHGTKLWQFVRQIGKYRREGKHRRDNEMTGMRVLRLAAIASSKYSSKI